MEHMQGVTPAKLSDDSALFGHGAHSAEAMGGSQVGRHRKIRAGVRVCISKRTSAHPNQRGAPYYGPQEQGSCATVQRVCSPPAPLDLGHSWQIWARSFPACLLPRTSPHMQEQCAWKVQAWGIQGEAVYGVGCPFLCVQGQPDRIRKHTTMLSCELSDNESPDLESLSQRDLSRMLTAQDTVLPNKRCKRVT